MAKLSLLFAVFLLFLLVDMDIFSGQGIVAVEGNGNDCEAKCTKRCSKSWKPKMCIKTCNTCCERCDGCVPDGPTASRDACPCYGQMKTHGDRYKCP